MALIALLALVLFASSIALRITSAPDDVMIWAIFVVLPLAVGSVVDVATPLAWAGLSGSQRPSLPRALGRLGRALMTRRAALLVYAGVGWQLSTALTGSSPWGLVGVLSAQVAQALIREYTQ